MTFAPSESKPLTAVLGAHTDLCEEIYQLMLDENRLLKGTGRPPEEAFLSRKRALLDQLTHSLEQLRGGAAKRRESTPELRSAMEKAQQTILRALLLDRENEQLLLKTTMPPRPPGVTPRVALSQLERIYGQHK
jgi:hypothetical protein